MEYDCTYEPRQGYERKGDTTDEDYWEDDKYYFMDLKIEELKTQVERVIISTPQDCYLPATEYHNDTYRNGIMYDKQLRRVYHPDSTWTLETLYTRIPHITFICCRCFLGPHPREYALCKEWKVSKQLYVNLGIEDSIQSVPVNHFNHAIGTWDDINAADTAERSFHEMSISDAVKLIRLHNS